MLSSFLQSESDILDLRLLKNIQHPMVFRYSEVFKAVLLNGLIAAGRIQPGVSISRHPFTTAARTLLSRSTSKTQAEAKAIDILGDFYENFQPESALQWFGLGNGHSNLRAWKPFEAVPPWRARSNVDYGRRILRSAIREAQENGVCDTVPEKPSLLWGKCGPVIPSIVFQEVVRIRNLVESMSTCGYLRENTEYGDIKAAALVRSDGSWRWIVTSGYHRACVACALGYLSIPIRIALVVQREDVMFWPHVVHQNFRNNEAAAVFDRFYEGNHNAFE